MTGPLALAERWLFRPAPPERVAVLRILVGGWCLYYIGVRRRMLNWMARGDAARFQPVGLARVHREPLPPVVYRWALRLTLGANVLWIAGVGWTVTGPLFAVLLLWLLSYRNSWSMIYHSDNVLVLHVLVLGVAPAADALAPGRRGGATAHWRYGWPVQLMTALTTLTYFVSGVAKVAGPLGISWADGEALRRQVGIDALRKDLLGGGAPPLALALYRRIALWRLIGVGSLVLELGAPLALLDRRLGRLWALGAWGMHGGILAIMGIKFRYQLSGLVFASFFPAERLLPRRALPPPPGPRA